MAKGYWIARVDVHDAEAYQAYLAANGAVFEKYGARFLVRGGTSEQVEGKGRQRNVVLEFLRAGARLLPLARIPAGQGAPAGGVGGRHPGDRGI